MTRPELDRQMRAALAQLETCSHVPAADWGPRGRSGETEGGGRPPGDIGHALFARAYGPPFHPEADERAVRAVLDLMKWEELPRDTERCRRVLGATKAEFEHLRGYAPRERPVGESLAQLSARIVEDGEGLTVREAAVHFRCGEQQVRRARKAEGRNMEDGKQPTDERLATEERQRRARELADSGHTLAQISRLLNASRSTVERDLGRRAA